jgi:hypothetical protein
MSDFEDHLRATLEAHQAACDITDCPVSESLLQSLADLESDESSSNDGSSSSEPATPEPSESTPDDTPEPSESENGTPLPAPVIRKRVIRTVQDHIKDFYESLRSPSAIPAASKDVIFFQGISLLGQSGVSIKTLLRRNNTGFKFGSLDQNHRILHIGNCLIALTTEHEYTWAKIKEDFDIAKSTAGAYKTFTNCVIKYPKLGQVSIPWRILKTQVKSVVAFIDGMGDGDDLDEHLRKSFWLEVPDYSPPSRTLPILNLPMVVTAPGASRRATAPQADSPAPAPQATPPAPAAPATPPPSPSASPVTRGQKRKAA